MKTAYKSLYSIILLIMLMLLMPLFSFAADTIRVNIPRVTVTMARSYNFTRAANDIYVPVEFNSAMSADKVADYIEESNAFLFDHYGDDVVEKNSTGGISRTSTKYDFRGNILAVNENHSAGSLTITKGTVYSYDQRGRMLSERGIDYDLNGNIVTLQRFGSSAGTAEDNLLYGYSGNRLTALTGSSRGAELNASYSYDAGGNMLYDGRRGLGISYNILNLPAKVVEKTGATVADGAVKAEYLYSADGIKQRVVDGAGSNGYLYLGTLVLSKSGEGYSLASTGFGGGRIIGGANNSCLAYYYGTDHLGSVRVITDGSGSVVERNDYYPMGMRTSTGNSYPQLATNLYKYNGKEVQTVGGLGFTDYGARMYDDFTGRWFVPDPLAEKYASMSPYMYCGGNPISMVDVDGRDWYQGKVKDGRMGIEWKNSQDLTIEDDAGITWTNIGENYIKENLGIITLYTQGKDKDGNLYKQSSEYYLDDESSMADLNSKVADLSSKGSAIAGSIGLLAENCSATFRLTNSKGLWKPKFYKNGWRGNQWVTPYSVSKLGKGVDYFGKTLGIIGMSASGFQFMQASTLEGKVEHGLDFFYGSYRFCA